MELEVWYVLVKDGVPKEADLVTLAASKPMVVHLRDVVVNKCKLDIAPNELRVYADEALANKLEADGEVKTNAIATAYYVVANTPVHVPAAAAHGTYFVDVPLVLGALPFLSCVLLVVIFGLCVTDLLRVLRLPRMRRKTELCV
jgi:hypothetical protein